MKPRYVIGTLLAAIMTGTAGLLVSVGLGDPGYLAGTSLGDWLGVRPPTVLPATGVTPALGGQAIGPLALSDLDGHPQSLPAGRRVLVNVWASWCLPCRDEMPLLARYAASQGTAGVAVVGLAEDSDVSVQEFLHQVPVGYPILLDDAQWRAGTRLGNRMGVLPFTVLIDADGHLLRHRAGPFDNLEALRQWVQAAN